MIFELTWQLVLDRLKHQTRRPVKPGQTVLEVEGTIYAVKSPSGRELYGVNHTYAIQRGRNLPRLFVNGSAVAEYGAVRDLSGLSLDYTIGSQYSYDAGWQQPRIKITGIRRERVAAITELDAQAEGFRSMDDLRGFDAGYARTITAVGNFAKAWESLHQSSPYRWIDEPLVWVLLFELLLT